MNHKGRTSPQAKQTQRLTRRDSNSRAEAEQLRSQRAEPEGRKPPGNQGQNRKEGGRRGTKGRTERKGAALFALAVRFALAVPRPRRRPCSLPSRLPVLCHLSRALVRPLLPVFASYFTSPSLIRYSAICTALRAAPLRIWSPVSQSVLPLSSARSLRMRPT